MFKLNQLWDTQINDYFKNDPLFVPCLSIDDISKRVPPQKPCFFIYNSASRFSKTNPSGCHWLLYYNVKSVNNPYPIFFDSFGSIPDSRIAKWSKGANKKRIYSCVQIQDLNSQACGYYCIYFADNLRKGRAFEDIILDFTSDTKANERVLKRYFKKPLPL